MIDWKEAEIDISKLVLDNRNPRIDVPPDASQKLIISTLLSNEKIKLADLMKSIVKNAGLFPAERIIVVKEKSQFLVLEGNRRACSCMLLVNNSLAPKSLRNLIPKIEPNLGKSIAKIPVSIAPDRKSVEKYITLRHTQGGTLPWSPMANQKRIQRFIEEAYSIQEIEDITGASADRIRKLLREYHFLKLARELGTLTKGEKVKLSDPNLQPTAYTRFFTLQSTKKTLGIEQNDNGEISSTLEPKAFEDAMTLIVRSFLIPDKKTNKAKFDTRAKPAEVFEELFRGHKNLAKLLPEKPKPAPPRRDQGNLFPDDQENTDTSPAVDTAPPTSTPQGQKKEKGNRTAPPLIFFKELNCPASVTHNPLRILTKEIRNIDHRKFPAAATFLMRALIEQCLQYCINKANLRSDFKKAYKTQYSGTKEPGLDYLFSYCLKRKKDIFAGNASKNLNQWKQHQYKEHADLVIHGKWAEPDIEILESAARIARPFIENVLNGDALA